MDIKINKAQSLEAIRSIDQNSDGGIDKKELFDALKLMMSQVVNFELPLTFQRIFLFLYKDIPLKLLPVFDSTQQIACFSKKKVLN